METSAVIHVILPCFFSFCYVRTSLACSAHGPETCNFETFDWCSWTPSLGDWEWFTDNTTYPGMNNSGGFLRSRQACSTQGRTGCLSFRYKFHGNSAIDLNVYILNAVNGGRLKVWSLSVTRRNPYVWHTASVPIVTNTEYFVELIAAQDARGREKVYVDNIDFMMNASCYINPPQAVATTTDVQGGLSCSKNGPESCWFSKPSWCNWNNIGWIFHNDTERVNVAAPDRTAWSRPLTSRSVCPIEGRPDCFTFMYKFSLKDAGDLKIVVKNASTHTREKVWTLSLPDKTHHWHSASVPIMSDVPFVVEIEVFWRRDHGVILIDDLVFWQDASACTIQPTNAAVTTSPIGVKKTTPSPHSTAIQSKTSRTSSMPLSTRKVKTLSSSWTTPSKFTHETMGTQTETSDIRTTTMNQSNKAGDDKQPPDTEISINVAVIVGAAIAVLVVLVIVLVLAILYKRNKLHCYRKMKNENFQNVSGHSDITGFQQSVTTDGNRDRNAGPSTGRPADPSDVDHYSTVNNRYEVVSVQDQGDPVSGAYAVVNTPKKGHATEQKKPASNEYAVPNCPRNSGNQKNQPAGSACQMPQGKKRTGDEYNVLQFDKSRKGVQERTDGEAGAVYSHLRKGDEDAYSKVDRERRTDVIGDKYSHVQHK